MAKFTADVKGGFFAQYAPTLGSINVLYNRAMDHRRAAQALTGRRNAEFRKIVDQLILSGVGSTATLTWPEIAASPELGGVRPVNNVTIINRTVDGNDIADVREVLTSLSSDTTMASPFNGDRNPLGTR